MPKIVDLNSLANGAVAERINMELQKILENINDPNTDPKKARKLTVSLTIKGDENRDLATVTVQAKSTFAPAKDVETIIVMDYDSKGQVTGKELKSGVKGQTFFDEEGVYEDTGEKIIDFRKQNQN
ncbi:replication terminator protein [Anaerobacillus isosaccharinicus]|uniref:Replication terminator protein n=1 Tax=Anaerobacillus isosaccharinicus TaxID=1532552 RepID=A0A1S2L9X8_9BACI|nr:replication terminator protein [Anaerobacillus isosaccharinicus]MBA5584549.1 replication terminator protein [Anaerobacillus isosaccharinicus]QOY37067.1 replication terminator protein [Anaerobacillus isosaccharinicus]